MKNDANEGLILDAGSSMRVQRDLLHRAEEQIEQMRYTLAELAQQREAQDRALAEIMALMDAGESGTGVTRLYKNLTPFAPTEIQANIQMTKNVSLTQESSWEEYLGSVERYARLEHLELYPPILI